MAIEEVADGELSATVKEEYMNDAFPGDANVLRKSSRKGWGEG